MDRHDLNARIEFKALLDFVASGVGVGDDTNLLAGQGKLPPVLAIDRLSDGADQ